MSDTNTPSHADSLREYAVFYFNGNKVIVYSLNSIGGGWTTVMSFVTEGDASAYFEAHSDPAKGDVLNASQVVALRRYHEVVAGIDEEIVEETSFLVSAL